MSNTKTVRNADFYLGRLKDLPPAFLRAAKTLHDDTVSKRILPLCVIELCRKLGLEYDKFSFENERKHSYAAIGELLEHFGLKLVPCSIPVDLEFTGTVFVTQKPNLSNDEDIAPVQDIIAQGRNPRQSDYVHILRMNEKLANYNIMLRVFEGLFTVSPGRLTAHQRLYLNSLLSELIMPIEGLSYLRACYTYAIEVRNCHCDYTDKKSCFKDLDADKKERECLYLGEIGARGAVRQCLCKDFPFFEELNRRLQQSYMAIPKDELMLLEGVRLDEAPASPTHKKYLLKGHLQTVKPNTQMSEPGIYDTPQVSDAAANEFTADLSSKIKAATALPEKLMALIGEQLQKDRFLALSTAPDFSKIELKRIEGEGLRPAAFIYKGYGFPALNYWPFILCTPGDALEALRQPGGAPFLNFLRKPPLPIPQRGSDEYVRNELQLCRQLFFALVLEHAAYPLKRDDIKRLIKDLKNEALYASEEFRPTLCAVYALHRILCAKPDARTDEKDLTLLNGLYAVPALLTLYLTRAYLESGTDEESFLKVYATVLKLRLLQYVSDHVSKLRKIRTVKNCGPEFIEYALKVLQGVDVTLWFGSTAGDGPRLRDPVPCPDRVFSDMLSHPFVKTCIAPLLERQVPERCGVRCINLKTSDLAAVDAQVLSHAHELIYLNTLPAGVHDPLAAMLSRRISDSEMMRLRQRLIGTSFASTADLAATLTSPGNRIPDEVVSSALRTCSLLQVPLDAALPRELRQAVPSRSFVECPQDLIFNERFMGRLGGAQLALIVYREITPGGSAASVLATRVADGEPAAHQVAADFLKKLEDQCKNLRPVSDAVFTRLYENSHHLETFSFFIACLKQVMRVSLAHSVFAVYEQRRFSHVFSLMHQKIQDQAPEDSALLPRRGFDNLDFAEVSSKISESREAQSVISKLVTEGELEEGGKDESANETLAPEPAPKAVTQAYPAPESKAEPQPHGNTSAGALSGGALKLIEAVAAQQADMIDRREFDGLCMSLGFMSGDAAIEEINDKAYEECGEPLFESAPEENAVYVTCDLLATFLG